MSTPTAIGPDKRQPYHWASMLDRPDPALSDLADGAEELAIPLQACREVLDKIADGVIDDKLFLANIAIALVALLDKADSKRDRLTEHLYRLAESERTTAGNHGSQDQP